MRSYLNISPEPQLITHWAKEFTYSRKSDLIGRRNSMRFMNDWRGIRSEYVINVSRKL